MQTRIRSYVSAVVFSAVASAATVYSLSGAASVGAWQAAFSLAALGVLTALLGYKMPRGGIASIALIPFIAAALVAPGIAAVAAVGLAQAIIDAFSRRQALK